MAKRMASTMRMSWVEREDRFVAGFFAVTKQVGGWMLDICLTLQVVAAVVILYGDPEPFKNLTYQLQYYHISWWFLSLQSQAFSVVLLAALVTGIWGIAERRIIPRCAARFFEIGRSPRLKK